MMTLWFALDAVQVVLLCMALALSLAVWDIVRSLHAGGEADPALRRGLHRLAEMEERNVENLADVMAAVQAQTTLVGGVVEFIKGLEGSAVDPAAKQGILDAIAANSATLEAAMAANVAPAPPEPTANS